MFIKFLCTCSISTTCDVVIGPRSEFVGLPYIGCVKVTGNAFQVVNNVVGIAVDVTFYFPVDVVVGGERSAFLYVEAA